MTRRGRESSRPRDNRSSPMTGCTSPILRIGPTGRPLGPSPWKAARRSGRIGREPRPSPDGSRTRPASRRDAPAPPPGRRRPGGSTGTGTERIRRKTRVSACFPLSTHRLARASRGRGWRRNRPRVEFSGSSRPYRGAIGTASPPIKTRRSVMQSTDPSPVQSACRGRALDDSGGRTRAGLDRPGTMP